MIITRKEKEKLARKEIMLHAAEEIFAEKGYTSATLDEIAEKAEFSKPAIYLYFKNKEDLFLNLFVSRLGNIQKSIQELIDAKKDPLEKINEIGLIHYDFHINHANFYRILLRVKGDISSGTDSSDTRKELFNAIGQSFNFYLNLVSEILGEAVSSKKIRKYDPVFLANVLIGVLNSLVYENLDSVDSDALKKKYIDVMEIFLKGVMV